MMKLQTCSMAVLVFKRWLIFFHLSWFGCAARVLLHKAESRKHGSALGIYIAMRLLVHRDYMFVYNFRAVYATVCMLCLPVRLVVNEKETLNGV